VSPEGRSANSGLLLFAPSDSKPTRGVISRTAEARLCPIHTTSCVNPDLPRFGVLDRIRLGQRYWFGLRTNILDGPAATRLQTQCRQEALSGTSDFARSA
jgi:hypothetical protein